VTRHLFTASLNACLVPRACNVDVKLTSKSTVAQCIPAQLNLTVQRNCLVQHNEKVIGKQAVTRRNC